MNKKFKLMIVLYNQKSNYMFWYYS